MHRIGICIFLAATCVCAQARAQGNSAGFSDEDVAKAIDKGVAYLLSLQKPDGSWAPFGQYITGPSGLATLALLESGLDPQEPAMEKALDWLAKNPETGNFTYCLGIRCNVWLSANGKTGGKYSEQFKKEVDQLVKSTADGSYNYTAAGDGKCAGGDNSTSQYGLYGAWAGALGNLDIDTQYWYKVMTHWLNSECSDGGWAYNYPATAGSPAMTTAGLASMFIVMDNLLSDAFIKCDVKQDLPDAIKRGLDWMDKHFAASLGGLNCYYMYGIERVGLASGYKYFGTTDWYKQGAALFLRTQAANGSWEGGYGGGPVGTAFGVLFLVRGRHAVLFNKLEYKGDWNNRPRALASLCRMITNRFESPVNWQIINLKTAVADWHDAPLLFISGSKAPEFSDEDIAKLRTYVLQGGTLFIAAECDGAAFKKGMREAYSKMFPECELTPVDKDNEFYSRTLGKVRFFAMSNGIRPLVIHTDDDVALRWQLNKTVSEAWAFEAAINVAMCVTDKGLMQPRGSMAWPDEPNKPAPYSVKLARLKWAGKFDPEPLAYQRFSRMMGQDGHLGVTVLGPMEISELPASGAKIASLTGIGELKVSDADKAVLKKFVADGGLLIIDAAGGSKAFADSADELVTSTFDRADKADRSLAIFNVPGRQFEQVKYRRRTSDKLGKTKEANFRVVLAGERIGVIFSKEDLTAALVGCTASTIDGYAPASAYAIMRNAVAMVAAQDATSQPAGAPAAAAAKPAAPAAPAPAPTPAAAPAPAPAPSAVSAPAPAHAPASTPALPQLMDQLYGHGQAPASAPAPAPATAPAGGK